jgi:hypothetical protein
MQRDRFGLRPIAGRIRPYRLKTPAPPGACCYNSPHKLRHLSACLFLFLTVTTAHAMTDTATAGRSAGVIFVSATVRRQWVPTSGPRKAKVVRVMIPGVGQNVGEMNPQKAQGGA